MCTRATWTCAAQATVSPSPAHTEPRYVLLSQCACVFVLSPNQSTQNLSNLFPSHTSSPLFSPFCCSQPMRVNPRQRALHAVFRTYLDVMHVQRDEQGRLFTLAAAQQEAAAADDSQKQQQGASQVSELFTLLLVRCMAVPPLHAGSRAARGSCWRRFTETAAVCIAGEQSLHSSASVLHADKGSFEAALGSAGEHGEPGMAASMTAAGIHRPESAAPAVVAAAMPCPF